MSLTTIVNKLRDNKHQRAYLTKLQMAQYIVKILYNRVNLPPEDHSDVQRIARAKLETVANQYRMAQAAERSVAAKKDVKMQFDAYSKKHNLRAFRLIAADLDRAQQTARNQFTLHGLDPGDVWTCAASRDIEDEQLTSFGISWTNPPNKYR